MSNVLSRLTARVTSGQVCRPHFHSPLHPWISAEGKTGMMPHPAHHPGHGHPGSASWCSPFGSKPVPSHHSSPPGMGVAHAPNASSHSSPHLFSFPPTPPKDATPDNVSGSASTANGNAQSGNPTGSEFGSASTGSQSSTASSTAGAQLAGTSVGSSDTLSSSAGAAELKPYYVNAATHHNMITSLGSALTNCSSSKPREGTGANIGANFSSSINQSAHTYHSTSISPYYPAHYVGSSSGPPTSGSVSDLSASSPYGFPHHSHHSASSLLSAKSIQSAGQTASKQRSKGRSSAGKRKLIAQPLSTRLCCFARASLPLHFYTPVYKHDHLSLGQCSSSMISMTSDSGGDRSVICHISHEYGY